MKHIITFAYYNRSGKWGLISRVVTTTYGLERNVIDELKTGIDNELGLVNASIPVSCINVTEPTLSIWHLTFLLDNCVNPVKPPTKYIHCTAETVGLLPSNILDKLVKRIREEEPDYKDYHLINSLETIKNIEPLKEAT